MDLGHKMTDEILSDMEKEITEIYASAKEDAQKKAETFFQKFEEKDKRLKAMVDSGQMSEDDYKQWRINKYMVGARYQAMADGLAADMTNANKIAASVINGHLPDVYATNYNWGTYKIEQDARIDTNFMIYDRQTVERLIREKPELLPMKAKISVPEDLRWNKKQINGVITQGILTGASIPEMAKGLAGVADMNKVSATRNARTMTTSAENGGRIDSYQRATDMGIKLTQEWLATGDARTRDEHRQLNGQEVPVGKPFKVDGYEIKFPADPEAPPFLVYNCRCCLVSNFKGFDYKKMDKYTAEKPMSYKQWEESRTKPQVDNSVVNGVNIASTFKRNADKFKYEIEDIVHAQGFDGTPKVVSPEEFEKYLEKSDSIMQRGYSAPSQEILDEYRNQLYTGEWYIDCSTGGDAHGKGMYCAAEKGTKVTEKMEATMQSYGSGRYAYVETFTWSETPKIINETEIKKLYDEYGTIKFKQIFENSGLTDDEILFLAGDSGFSSEGQDFMEFFKNHKDKMPELFKMKGEKINEIGKLQDDIIHLDNGSIAAMFGYDAINCDTTKQGYMVILNRTKLVFKGGD